MLPHSGYAKYWYFIEPKETAEGEDATYPSPTF